MDLDKMSEPEKLSGFYKQWVEHWNAGGENSQEEWEKLGRAWKLAELPKKQPTARSPALGAGVRRGYI